MTLINEFNDFINFIFGDITGYARIGIIFVIIFTVLALDFIWNVGRKEK